MSVTNKFFVSLRIVVIVFIGLFSRHFALAESYYVGGLVISPPSTVDFDHIENNMISFNFGVTESIIIVAYNLQDFGLTTDSMSLFGEEMALKYVANTIANYEFKLSEIQETSNKKYIELTNEKETSSMIGNTKFYVLLYDTSFVLVNIQSIVGYSKTTLDDVLSWISISNAKSTIVQPQTETPKVVDGKYLLNNGLIVLTLDDTKYNIISKDNDESSRTLTRLPYSKEELDSFASLNNYDLTIFPIDTDLNEFSIHIRIKEDSHLGINNIADFDEDVSNWFFEIMMNGFDVEQYHTVRINGILFCVFDWQIMGSTQRRYATIYDEDMIYIWAEREGKTLQFSDIQLLEEVIRNIEIRTEPEKSTEINTSDSYLYEMIDVPLSFFVPNYWEAQEEYFENVYYVEFFNTESKDNSIQVVVNDLWAVMIEEDEITSSFLGRDVIDQNLFSSAEIAEILGVKEEDVELLSINGTEYYKTCIDEQMLYVNLTDGYLCMCAFVGSENDASFVDFQKILETLRIQ